MKKITRDSGHFPICQKELCTELLQARTTMTGITEYLGLGTRAVAPHKVFKLAKRGVAVLSYSQMAKAVHMLCVLSGRDNALPLEVDLKLMLQKSAIKFDSKTACSRSIGISHTTYNNIVCCEYDGIKYETYEKILAQCINILTQKEFDSCVVYASKKDNDKLLKISSLMDDEVSTPKRILDKILNKPTPPAPRLIDDLSPLKKLQGKRFDANRRERYEIRKSVLMASVRFNRMSFADKRKELEALYLQEVA